MRSLTVVHAWQPDESEQQALVESGHVFGEARWLAVAIRFYSNGQTSAHWSVGGTRAQAEERARGRMAQTNPAANPARGA